MLLAHAVTDPKLGEPPLIRSFTETTAVDFAELSPELIRAYIATGENSSCRGDRMGLLPPCEIFCADDDNYAPWKLQGSPSESQGATASRALQDHS